MAHGLIFKLLITFSLATVFLDASSSMDKADSEVSPYLMPNDHPIKSALDTLFGASRVILNLETLEAAGFKKSKPRKFTKLIVTTHPLFPDYVFKLYLDTQRFYKNTYEYILWMQRIQGVEKVRREIHAHELEWGFKAPKKWIYALPSIPPPSKDYPSKRYILVEENMELVSDEENKRLWASNNVSPALLDALFHILRTVGLDDCVKPDNLPFSTDGRVSFIDTQTFDRRVRYKRLLPFLSIENKAYWAALINNEISKR